MGISEGKAGGLFKVIPGLRGCFYANPLGTGQLQCGGRHLPLKTKRFPAGLFLPTQKLTRAGHDDLMSPDPNPELRAAR